DDAIAFFDAVPFQHICEAADFTMQLLIGEGALVAGFALPNDCRFVPARPVKMTVHAILRNVQFPAHEPFCEWGFPFEDLLPRRAPDQFLRFAHPELGGLPNRFSIHSPVLSQVLDPGFTAETWCWLEDAFFDQMRFNVVVHGQSLICARTFQGKRASLRPPVRRRTNPSGVPTCGWSNVVRERWTGHGAVATR